MQCNHIWGNGLSETITECLSKQLEQLQPLTDALGRLHLGSSPGGSGEPLASSPSRVKCVCYGLGTFASCPTARIQLAFMLLFLEKCQVSLSSSPTPGKWCICAWNLSTPLPFQIPRSQCWVYDPLFTQTEVSVLTSLGVTVLGENEVGAFISSRQTTPLLVDRLSHWPWHAGLPKAQYHPHFELLYCENLNQQHEVMC